MAQKSIINQKGFVTFSLPPKHPNTLAKQKWAIIHVEMPSPPCLAIA
jgi:hypothetical protein